MQGGGPGVRRGLAGVGVAGGVLLAAEAQGALQATAQAPKT